VLSDVSFHLRRGERLALVGENGQGKTTIVKLPHGCMTQPQDRFYWTAWICGNTTWKILWRETGCDLPGLHALRHDGGGKHRYREIEERENTFRVRSAAQKELSRAGDSQNFRRAMTRFSEEDLRGAWTVWRRVAEDGSGEGIFARRAAFDTGRTHGGAGCEIGAMKYFSASPN